jgi:hypothetical protein
MALPLTLRGGERQHRSIPYVNSDSPGEVKCWPSQPAGPTLTVNFNAWTRSFWHFGCYFQGMAEKRSLPQPAEELKDIGEILNCAKTDTNHLHDEIESMLGELRSITGGKPDSSKAA